MTSRRIRFSLIVACLALPLSVSAANPFVEWKDRLFGSRSGKPDVRDAPEEGVVVLGVERPERLHIDRRAPERDFPLGRSRYREVELAREFEHVAVRVQVIARGSDERRGNTVYKPVFYLLNEDGSVRDSRPADPLHLDIRPFKPTRLLSCVLLEDVQRFAVATTPAAIGKSYESKARDKVKAPTRGNFHYSTEAVKVRLPYAETGELILELVVQDEPDTGC